ncbi:hypothetical protein E8E14_002970 [Neopestalotiopsis sp. 37M]|nr:hypothetical protein E8E14_002970 [Neopestalotiopsis sp. 37M]
MVRGTSLMLGAATAVLAGANGRCTHAACSNATLPLPVKTVYQFDTESWVENLAVRPNGDLLLIVDEDVTNPVHPVSLYQLAGPASPQPELSLVYSFDPELGTILGIAEIQPEVYAVLADNFTGNFEAVPGTLRLFTFDYNNNENDDSGAELPTVTEIVPNMPNITIGPDGIAALPGQPDIVLAADMYAARVWSIDVRTGAVDVFAQTPEMAQVHNATMIGINGVRVSQGYLYWTNSDLQCVYRLPLDECGGGGSEVAELESELVANLTVVSPVFIDDFTIGRDGTLWVTSSGPQNVVVAVRPDAARGGFQDPVVVAGAINSTAVQGDVGAAFGRGPSDRDVLYVSTNGGLWGAGLGLNQTATEPGKVAAVDTRCFASL